LKREHIHSQERNKRHKLSFAISSHLLDAAHAECLRGQLFTHIGFSRVRA
jgi:hypothetical protein